jgi:hypothetical protein
LPEERLARLEAHVVERLLEARLLVLVGDLAGSGTVPSIGMPMPGFVP